MAAKSQQSKHYLPLARKYRPLNFSSVLGNDTLVRIIGNSIVRERIHHAYLLSGVRGTGKTTVARLIAMSINCEQRGKNSFEPCLKCESCKLILSGNHLDVIEFDAASHTGIEDIREITENIMYLPSYGIYKVYIIDEVHMLSIQAFNALLKTLEEPPKKVVFIFATTEIRKIPKTILSRCLKFELKRISQKDLLKLINFVAKSEGFEIEAEAKMLIIQHSGGSARDCLSLLDLASAISNSDKISALDVRDMLGLSDIATILSLLEAIISGQTKEALAISNKLYDLGCDYNLVCEELLVMTYNLLESKLNSNDTSQQNIPKDMQKRISSLANKIEIESIIIIWQMLIQGQKNLSFSNLTKSSFDILLLSIIHTKDIINFDEEFAKLSSEFRSNKDIEKTSNSREGVYAKPVNTEVKAIAQKVTSKDNKTFQTFDKLVEFVAKSNDNELLDILERYIKVRKYQPHYLEIVLTEFAKKGLVADLRKKLVDVTSQRWEIKVVACNGSDLSVKEKKQRLNENKIKMIEEQSDFKKITGSLAGKIVRIED